MYFNFYNDDYLFYYYFTLPPSSGGGGDCPRVPLETAPCIARLMSCWVTTGQVPYNPTLHVYVYPTVGIASRVTTERIPYNPELYYLVLYPIAGKAC